MWSGACGLAAAARTIGVISRGIDPIVSWTAWLPAPTVGAMTREQREFVRMQIDALMRERLSAADPSRRGSTGARLTKTPRRLKSWPIPASSQE